MTTPRISVDRIEGSRAILDIAGEQIEVPASILPTGAAEGSLLSLRLEEATAADEAAARLERLRARSPSLDDIDF